MIRVETSIEGENHIPFSMTWAGTGQASLDARMHRAGSSRCAPARELNLSGYQLLTGCALLMGLATAFLWALKLWLFET